MLNVNQHWNAIRAAYDFGAAGLAPTCAIQRRSDGQWLQAGGGSWGAGYATNPMVEVDGTNLIGVYEYDVPSARLTYAQGLSGYRIKMIEGATEVFQDVHVLRSEWDELTASHVTNATFGAAAAGKTAAQLSDTIWDEDVTGHLTANTAGVILYALASGLLNDEPDAGKFYVSTAVSDSTGTKFYPASAWPEASEDERFRGRIGVLSRPGGLRDMVRIDGVGEDGGGPFLRVSDPFNGGPVASIASGTQLLLPHSFSPKPVVGSGRRLF
jgi:hypothetical protein